MESTVCRYFQTGFCKYAETCRKHHVQKICSTTFCKNKLCTKRHPKPCKHFKSFNACKFGDSCAYTHHISKEESDYMKLVTTVSTLENQVKDMCLKISNLEKELQNSIIKEAFLESKIKCDKCEYTASSNTVLKRHNSMKHNNSANKTPEKVRGASHNDSLQLSPISDERSEETTPVFLEQVNSELNHNFKCEYCDTTTVSQHALKGHKDFYHTPNLPHTSDWEENTCHICNKHFDDTSEFKSHMINEHSFSEEIAVCYQCEVSTDVGIYRPVPLQWIFMECKNCMKLV